MDEAQPHLVEESQGSDDHAGEPNQLDVAGEPAVDRSDGDPVRVSRSSVSDFEEYESRETSPTRIIEAILMVATEPVSTSTFARLLNLPDDIVEATLAELRDFYTGHNRGFELKAVAGGWRFQSHPDLGWAVSQWVVDSREIRLSAAAMETLAIVAYKQPLSRAQIASVRGVNVDGVLRTLVTRGLISEVGRDPGPGQAVMFGTTDLFLDRLGIASTADLPPIADFVPDPEIVEALEQGLRPLVD